MLYEPIPSKPLLLKATWMTLLIKQKVKKFPERQSLIFWDFFSYILFVSDPPRLRATC